MSDLGPGSPPEKRTQDVGRALTNLREQLAHLEHLVSQDAATEGNRVESSWRGEHRRFPAVCAIIIAVTVQACLPSQYIFHPRWLLPVVAGVLVIVLLVGNPGENSRLSSTLLRLTSLTLDSVLALANGLSAVLLALAILDHRHGVDDPASLLAVAVAIYLTNVVVFSLWYWEFDSAGPASRAQGLREPDFLFAQMTVPELSPHWQASYLDYLYFSYTNATTFSPADTLPLAIWAKMLMMVQSVVSLVLITLVVSHAINLLR